MKDFLIQVVVPCYNEEHRLPVDEFRLFLHAFEDIHILFVDDGSRDRTYDVIQSVVDQFPGKVEGLRLDVNSGKAAAVRSGLLYALKQNRYQAVGFWDADLATPLDVIPQFAGLLYRKPELDMVLGSRVKLMGHDIQRRPLRHYLGRVFATAASVALGLSVYDTQCGAKLFRTGPDLQKLLDEPFCSKWIFDVEILARYLRVHQELVSGEIERRIYEYALPVWHDIAGSKVKPTDFFRAFGELMRIYWKYRLF